MNSQSIVKKARILACIALLSACNSNNEPDTPAPSVNFTEVKGSGDISAQISSFRTLLGDQLNTTPGQTVGRREINWDGVPDNQTNTDTFPGDFFNSTDPAVAAGRKRGAVFSTPGKGLRISDKNFSDLVSGYKEQFNAFSPARTFSAVGSNKMDVTFKVPGTATAAFVKGFGVVLSDVDKANSTTLEFFEGDKSLGKFTAPARKDANGFSFIGAIFPDSKVTKVTITAGSTSISNKYADNADNDLVIMDDFFYSEPSAL
ncbi:hypothetical protein [Dyadobacter crusticola]|uniref:hypothetical protein n=1 Tax=Dyadobacter crusticola TaxID=292407 RepID=UPI00054DBF2E|nr:hypothetical protein [Dyadobacter crusticola]